MIQRCLQPKSFSPSSWRHLAPITSFLVFCFIGLISRAFEFSRTTLLHMGEPQQKCLFSLALATFAILSTIHYLQVHQNEGHSGAERERVHLSDVFISLKTTACLLSCEFFLHLLFIFQRMPPFKILIQN